MSCALRLEESPLVSLKPRAYTVSYKDIDEMVEKTDSLAKIKIWGLIKRTAVGVRTPFDRFGQRIYLDQGQCILTERRMGVVGRCSRRQVKNVLKWMVEKRIMNVKPAGKIGTIIALHANVIRPKALPKEEQSVVKSGPSIPEGIHSVSHFFPPKADHKELKNNNNKLYITPIYKPRHREPAKLTQYSRGVLALLAYAEKGLKTATSRAATEVFCERAMEWENANGGALGALADRVDWLAANEGTLTSRTTSINRIWFIDVVAKMRHANRGPRRGSFNEPRRDEPMAKDERYDKWYNMEIADWLESGDKGTYLDYMIRVNPHVTRMECLYHRFSQVVDGTEKASEKKLCPIKYRLGKIPVDFEYVNLSV